MTSSINVYIDGSCVNNGHTDAKAGYGVFFAEGDIRNEYKRVVGKQTNNTGELTAFIRAIEILHDKLHENVSIDVYTDSEYVIKCLTSYGDKLKMQDWVSKVGKKIPNKDLVKRAYELYVQNKYLIRLHHIKAHTDEEDEHSLGNKEADRLANLALGLDGCPYQKKKKHYINISYNNKDAAKALGALWDIKEKKWYYNDELSDENKLSINLLEFECTNSKDLVPIIEEINKEDNKVYLKIPYKNKDIAKKYGAKWM